MLINYFASNANNRIMVIAIRLGKESQRKIDTNMRNITLAYYYSDPDGQGSGKGLLENLFLLKAIISASTPRA